MQKSPQVVKGENWACSTPKAGKKKPIMIIAKTRDFKRFCEKIKENRRFVMNLRTGLTEAHMVERPFLSVFLLLCNRNFSFLEVRKSGIFCNLSGDGIGLNPRFWHFGCWSNMEKEDAAR